MIGTKRHVWLGAGILLSVAACSDDDSQSSSNDDTSTDAATLDGGDGTSPEGGDGEAPALPVLTDDVGTTALGIPVIVDVLANDEDGSEVKLVSTSDPSNGTVEIRGGQVVYTPGVQAGDAEFEYTVARDDDEGSMVSALVTITVLPHPGTVAFGQLYTAEVDDDISWLDVNARGDRLGEYEQGANEDSIVFVPDSGDAQVVPPPQASPFVLGRGLADDGTVIAQYMDDTRYQFIGFTWKDGAYDRTCDLGDGLGDCTPESMANDGTIVGTAYDYTLYTGFVWPEGGDRMPLSVDGYAHTYAHDIAPDGTVIGIADDSSDGYSGPSRCFAGVPGELEVLPFEDGDPHFVSCRAINAEGLIVGHVKARADEAGVPRSMTDPIRAGVWLDDQFAYLPFPVERPSADSWRVEVLLGVNDDGVMVGYFQDATLIPATDDEDETTQRVTRGITLTPVEALPGTSFEDSTFDHVNGAI